MTASTLIILNPWLGHRKLLWGCIFDLKMITHIFPNSPYIYIYILSKKKVWQRRGWFCAIGFRGRPPLLYRNPGSKDFVCFLSFPCTWYEGQYTSLFSAKSCEKKSLSLGHTESVKQASFTPQYSIGLRSMKSTARVLAPNPWLCPFLAANQEHL